MPLSTSRQIGVSDPEKSFYDAWECLKYTSSDSVGEVRSNTAAKAFSTTVHMSESDRSSKDYEISQDVYAVLSYTTNPDGTSATLEISDYRSDGHQCYINYMSIDKDGDGSKEWVVDPWEPEKCSDYSDAGVDADYLAWYSDKAVKKLSVLAECIARKQETREKAEEKKAGKAK